MPAYKRRQELLTLVTSFADCPVEISKKDYLSIVEGFMQFISDKVIEGNEVVLPVGMGKLEITGRKPKITIDEDGNIKGLAPDWKRTKELWEKDSEAKTDKKIIYFFNEHTRGVRYKVKWITTDVALIFKSVLTFKAVRNVKRRIWKEILNGKEYRITVTKN